MVTDRIGRLTALTTIAWALALPLCAGIVGGVVLDQGSGRPLARTVIILTPVPAIPGGIPPTNTQTARAGVGGTFTFTARPGFYLLTATRDAFFPASYGSRRPAGKGVPFEVTKDSQLFAELRMRRKGGVTGHVFDENGVPMAGIPVIAYRARLPLRTAVTATSDDRGIYRIGGLDPGKYWVRTGGQRLDDGSSWLPTFGPGSRESSQAKAEPVRVDNDTEFADVNPEPGQLFLLAGAITCDYEGPVTVRLSSETVQKTTSGACGGGFRLDGLAPADYEISAVSPDGKHSGFTGLFVDRDTMNASVQVSLSGEMTFDITVLGGGARPRLPVTVYATPVDLSGTGPEVEVKAPMAMPTGYWQFRAVAPAGYAVDDIRLGIATRARTPRAQRATESYEIYIPARAPSRLSVVLTSNVGRIAGSVKAQSKALPGVPVYLIPEAAARRSLGGPRQTLSDTSGAYHFDDLPLGDYRLVASYDVNDIDEDLPDVRIVGSAKSEAGKTSALDLDVWDAPGF